MFSKFDTYKLPDCTKKKQGLTLLEIIIVVALLGTLGVYLITNLTQQAIPLKSIRLNLPSATFVKHCSWYRVHLKKYPTTDTGLQVCWKTRRQACAAPTSTTPTNYSTRGMPNLNTSRTDATSRLPRQAPILNWAQKTTSSGLSRAWMNR